KLTVADTGHEIVGHDLDHRPHTFGATKDRALLNAIEYHKRLIPPERIMTGPEFPEIAEGAFAEGVNTYDKNFVKKITKDIAEDKERRAAVIENTTFGDWDTNKKKYVKS